jgi:hypothetical protein
MASDKSFNIQKSSNNRLRSSLESNTGEKLLVFNDKPSTNTIKTVYNNRGIDQNLFNQQMDHF